MCCILLIVLNFTQKFAKVPLEPGVFIRWNASEYPYMKKKSNKFGIPNTFQISIPKIWEFQKKFQMENFETFRIFGISNFLKF